MLRLALYHPQIPQNTGTLMRFCACMDIGLDIIHPIGFILDDKRLLRSSMDYRKHLNLREHVSFQHFCDFYATRRMVALDLHQHASDYCEFEYHAGDVLVAGTEAFGFKEHDLACFSHFVQIPMRNNLRSLNMAMAAGIVASHAQNVLLRATL